jgi:hypothetical protein
MKTLVIAAVITVLSFNQVLACSPPLNSHSYTIAKFVTTATNVVEATYNSKTQVLIDKKANEKYFLFTIHR